MSGDIVVHEGLSDIADRIRDRLQRHTSDMVAIGADLSAVKERLEHGEFVAWIKREFSLTARSAQLYMCAAAFAEGKSEIVSHLQPSALRLLSAPSTPAAIQDEVVEAIRAGADVDFKAVETRVKADRQTRREEQRKRSRRSSATPDSLKRHAQRMKRADAEAEKRNQERRVLIEEAAAILRELPAPHQARLRQICTELRYASLAEVLPSAVDLEAGP